MALTAASFCVFLTRVFTFATAATFFAAALRATGFAAAFLALTAGFAFAAAFFAALTFLAGLAGFRAVDFAVTALLAFGLEGDLALTVRFAVADFALERDVDRLKPFVRLLLMCGSQKAAHLIEQRGKRPELTIEAPLNQRAQLFAGALTWPKNRHFRQMYKQRKTLEGHCWLCYSASWLTEA